MIDKISKQKNKILYKTMICLVLSIIFLNILNPVHAVIKEDLPVSELKDEFPGSYKPYIEKLKEIHPNWVFKAVYTNLDWNLVLKHESYEVNPEISLINKYDYNEKWLYNGDNIAHDGPFYTASKSAVAYALDPRNFLSETCIFQFETLSFSENVHTISSVEKVLLGTKMASEEYKNKYKCKGEWIEMSETYSEMIVRLSKKYNISPTHVASRIRQENSGNVVDGALINGDHGVYNFFNIGAVPGSDGNSAVTNGLNYAKNNGWTTPEKSIEAGIAVLVKNYIQYGQDTIYFQKFDVNNPYGNASSLFAFQYMTNIMAPFNESKSAYNGYVKADMINSAFEFHIPVYNNMPKTASPSPEDDNHYNEFVTIKNNTYYYNSDGEKVTGWQDIDGNRYYFDQSGVMFKGINVVDGVKYFFGVTKGRVMKGWLNYDGATYYMNEETGEVASGVTRVDGKDYFFGIKKNRLMRGLINDNGTLYYTDNNGLLQTGMIQIDGKWYYFGEDYTAVSGLKEIDNLTYYFDPDTKVRASGITEVEGKKYFFGITKGKMMKGFLNYDGATYYMNEETGEVASGVTRVDGKDYFFGIKKNRLMRGLINDNGTLYYTDNNGLLQTGMIQIDGKWYYFGEDYTAVSGLKEIDNLTYYFDPETKVRASGITEVDGKKYFFGITKGKMMKGWLTYNGLTYYMDEETGEMAHRVSIIDSKPYFFGVRTYKLMRGLINDNGTLYYANSDGILQTGMIQIDGKWYYFGEDYTAVSGLKEIDNLTYYFDPETKVRASGITEVDGKKYFFGITKGKMMKGWLTYNGLTYYMDEETGEMAHRVSIIDSKPYFFGVRTYKLMRGLINDNGTLYYADSNGILQTGKHVINGITYDFDKDTYKAK